MAFGLLTKRIAKSQRTMKARPREEPNDLYEMANLFPEDTGLPVTVRVSPRGHARHAARIEVCRVPGNKMVLSNTAAMRIAPEPGSVKGKLPSKYLEPVTRWIAENSEALLKYWDGEIGTGASLIGRLKKLGASGPNA